MVERNKLGRPAIGLIVIECDHPTLQFDRVPMTEGIAETNESKSTSRSKMASVNSRVKWQPAVLCSC